MDELDLAIVEALQMEGRRPYTDIAQQLGISEGTVRNRVTRLIEDQILRIVGIVDPASQGLTAPAVIGISVSGGNIEKIAQEIARFPEVNYLIMVSGEFDLILEVLCRDRRHLANFLNDHLRQVVGVERTQTFMALRTFKTPLGARLSIEAPES
jgi:Lrp/AsnC family transcriptional regulator for asnA, asnC and gidA